MIETDRNIERKSAVRRQFGDNADGYVTSRVHAKGASLTRLVELVRPQAHWLALDVATGAGHTALAFAPHVLNVLATDLTPRMLEVARELADEREITNVRFEPADAEDLPFTDDTFDLVTCRIAAHHFERVPTFLAEAARVLRPGGTLAVVDNVAPEDPVAARHIDAFERLRDPSHGRYLSLGEWTAQITAAGFVIDHQETASKDLEFGPWASRMQVSQPDRTRLLEMLDGAPPGAQAYWAPRQIDGARRFRLLEGITVAHTLG